MKKYLAFIICLAVCLLMFSGCSCKHTWVEADCITAKTCSECQATEGEPLGHTPGQWQEVPDPVSATLFREQRCTVCGEQTGSEAGALATLIQDGLFLFTPNEFMERLTDLANQHLEGFHYEFVSTNGLMAHVYSGEKQALLQFFRNDATLLAGDEKDTAEVWCVSLTSIDEADADLRYCFFMACDPTLTKDAASDLDIQRSVGYLNAASSGEAFGYFEHNDLLYESIYIPAGELGQANTMNLVNIYASDFR